MEQQLIEVELIKMIDPGNYFLKEKECQEFYELSARINAYYNCDGFTHQSTKPILGQCYIGKEQAMWYRVRVDHVVQRTAGPHASCFLLDYGKDCVMISLQWLREARNEFFQVPFQVHHCVLHNVYPVTLVMDVELNNSYGPASKWDEAATVFMKDVSQKTKLWKSLFLLEKDGKYEIELYAYDDDNVININELLVSRNYAAFKDPSNKGGVNLFSEKSLLEGGSHSKVVDINNSNSLYGHDSLSKSSLSSIGRGSLLKSLITSKPTPLVGWKSSESSSEETGLNRSIHSPAGSLKSWAASEHYVSLSDSPETDKLHLSESERCCQLSSSMSAAGKFGIKSRVPRHLKSDLNKTTMNSSALSGFVIPNTNASDLPVSTSNSEFPLERCKNTKEINPQLPDKSSQMSVSDADIAHQCTKVDQTSFVENLFPVSCAIPVVSPERAKQLTAEDLEIVVDNGNHDKCVTDINTLPFIDLIQRTPGLTDMNQPTKLQAFVWPAVLRGIDVIGISGPKYKDGNSGGETLSYLLPIISLLSSRSIYKDLPKFSISPYVLILCPSSSGVLSLYDQCKHILEYQLRLQQIDIRVHLLFGGGGDEGQEINLINGCEILISTPHSFLRMMDKKVTNLNRVCHLVLEEADELTEHFKPELELLMAQYKLELKEREKDSGLQQILLFSQRWSSAMKEFSLENQVSPLVVVAAKMESAYYGQVKQRPIMCHVQQRYNQVLSLLEARREKVVVFTSSSEEAKTLHKELDASAIHALLAHDEMNSSDFAKVNCGWNQLHHSDSKPILVLTDVALRMLNISDACWVIHFDVPSQLEVFADRLWCLRKYYEPYEVKKITQEDDCISFILVTEECEQLSSRLIRVLQRCGEKIPRNLAKMSEKHTEAKEQGKRNLLCHNMKSFGVCRNQISCHYRHKVFSSLDQPGLSSRCIKLPTEGTIKVWIKNIVDASCFYVHLHEHQSLDGHVTNLRAECANLSMDMAHYFGSPSNRTALEIAEVSKLYAVQDLQHIFHRVEVTKLLTSESANYPDRAEVFHVDIGQTMEVEISELFKLPSHLVQVPYQAVEVFICRVKPVDRDFTWTLKSCMYLTDKIQYAILFGNIVLSLGNTLWLDPLLKRDFLPDLKIWQTDFTVRLLLLEAGYAEENPKHLELLYKACEGVIQPPSGVSTSLNTTHAYTSDGQLVLTKTEEFPECTVECFDVYVTAVKSPDLLYVQLASNEKRLDQLNDDINRTMFLADDTRDFEPKQGLLVLAKDPYTARWLRGRIEAMPEGQPLEVFFVDTGTTEDLSLKEVSPMPLRFKHLPFQAIECSLIGLEPVHQGYLDKCANVIMELTGDNQQQLIKVQALVVRKTKARYTGRYNYGINLYNLTSTSYQVNVASQLVVENYARLSSYRLKELYPLAYEDGKESHCHQITRLCRDILETRDKVMLNELASGLEKVIEELCNGRNGSTAGMIAVVGQTLEYTWEAEVAPSLILSLQMLSKDNPNHCSELEASSIWDVLCHIFVKQESNGLQDEMLLLFKSLFVCKRCCETFVQCGGLWYLGNVLLRLNLDFVIQTQLQLVLTTLVNTSYSVLTPDHLECLKAAVHHLTQSHPSIISICLDILEQLAIHHFKCKDEIRKHNGIRVLCEQITFWKDQELLVNKAVKLLMVLTTGNRFNRDEVAKWLSSMFNEKIPNDVGTLKLYEDLQKKFHQLHPKIQCHLIEKMEAIGSSLVKHGPRRSVCHEPINNQPIPKELLMIVSESRRPPVKWTQNFWDILLTVEVKDAKTPQDVATFTADSIVFRAVAMNTEYNFYFALYELVLPEQCKTFITAGCIYVGLKKKLRGIWPRLLRDKHLRCPFLSIDFNRFEDVLESSGDENDDDNDDKHKSPLDLMHHRSDFGVVKSDFLDLPPASQSTKYDDATPDLSMPKKRASFNDKSSSSSSESDDDIDAKFDPRFMEDVQLGYHAL